MSQKKKSKLYHPTKGYKIIDTDYLNKAPTKFAVFAKRKFTGIELQQNKLKKRIGLCESLRLICK